MYENILVPTDGHEYVGEALEHALGLASLTGGRVHGLYVVDTREYSTLPEAKWLEEQDELRERAEGSLETLESACEAEDVPFIGEVERGVPTDVIVDYADAHDIDLIVMATHGRTGIDHFLHGSITDDVIHKTGIPVIAIHIDEDDD